MRALPSMFLIAAALGSSGVYAQTGAEYYPLGKGNFWVYTVTPIQETAAASDTTRREVAFFQADGDSAVAGVKNEYPGQAASYQWFRTGPQGGVLFISLGTSPDRNNTLIDFDPPLVLLPEKPKPGDSWEMKMRREDGTLFTAGTSRVESSSETVTVPAGTFRDCLKMKLVTFDGDGKEVSAAQLYCARGVGEVLSERTEPGGRRFREELVKYSVK